MRLILLHLIQGYPYQIFFVLKIFQLACMYRVLFCLNDVLLRRGRHRSSSPQSLQPPSLARTQHSRWHRACVCFWFWIFVVVADNKGFGLGLSQLFEFWVFDSLLTHITQGPYTKCSQLQGLKKCHFPQQRSPSDHLKGDQSRCAGSNSKHPNVKHAKNSC